MSKDDYWESADDINQDNCLETWRELLFKRIRKDDER